MSKKIITTSSSADQFDVMLQVSSKQNDESDEEQNQHGGHDHQQRSPPPSSPLQQRRPSSGSGSSPTHHHRALGQQQPESPLVMQRPSLSSTSPLRRGGSGSSPTHHHRESPPPRSAGQQPESPLVMQRPSLSSSTSPLRRGSSGSPTIRRPSPLRGAAGRQPESPFEMLPMPEEEVADAQQLNFPKKNGKRSSHRTEEDDDDSTTGSSNKTAASNDAADNEDEDLSFHDDDEDYASGEGDEEEYDPDYDNGDDDTVHYSRKKKKKSTKNNNNDHRGRRRQTAAAAVFRNNKKPKRGGDEVVAAAAPPRRRQGDFSSSSRKNATFQTIDRRHHDGDAEKRAAVAATAMATTTAGAAAKGAKAAAVALRRDPDQQRPVYPDNEEIPNSSPLSLSNVTDVSPDVPRKLSNSGLTDGKEAVPGGQRKTGKSSTSTTEKSEPTKTSFLVFPAHEGSHDKIEVDCSLSNVPVLSKNGANISTNNGVKEAPMSGGERRAEHDVGSHSSVDPTLPQVLKKKSEEELSSAVPPPLQNNSVVAKEGVKSVPSNSGLPMSSTSEGTAANENSLSQSRTTKKTGERQGSSGEESLCATKRAAAFLADTDRSAVALECAPEEAANTGKSDSLEHKGDTNCQLLNFARVAMQSSETLPSQAAHASSSETIESEMPRAEATKDPMESSGSVIVAKSDGDKVNDDDDAQLAQRRPTRQQVPNEFPPSSNEQVLEASDEASDAVVENSAEDPPSEVDGGSSPVTNIFEEEGLNRSSAGKVVVKLDYRGTCEKSPETTAYYEMVGKKAAAFFASDKQGKAEIVDSVLERFQFYTMDGEECDEDVERHRVSRYLRDRGVVANGNAASRVRSPQKKKRKRGRPAKANENVALEISFPPKKRKRGRPAKKKVSSADAALEVGSRLRKRRRRWNSKTQTLVGEEESDHDEMRTEPGNGTTEMVQKEKPVVSDQLLESFLSQPYVEELAYHFLYTASDVWTQLRPMPKPRGPPDLPLGPVESSRARWSYDEQSRVVLADFKNVVRVHDDDKTLLGQLMQRDDITIVSEGLVSMKIQEEELLLYMQNSFKGVPYHKFRRFDQMTDSNPIQYKEVDGFVSMGVSDYRRYMEIRRRGSNQSLEECQFTYEDEDNKEHTVDALKVVFYMIDVDMPRHLRKLDKEYKRNFKIKEILPGGSWCMMHDVAQESRPFMGPNFYVAPGGGYTQVHQDGHGTVDSGHSCLSGYNEVIMLRRLPECHKLKACSLIPTSVGQLDESAKDVLYKLPHDDKRKQQPLWPTMSTVKMWEDQNYCPSVFILKPGQHVHINKGRLHAFRKLTYDTLPQDDCHQPLRQEIIASIGPQDSAPLCVSIAFDWMFLGVDGEGINREVSSIVECASLCREHDTSKSLAIPELALLEIAKTCCEPESPMILDQTQGLMDDSRIEVARREVARGILPSLRYLADKDSPSGGVEMDDDCKPDSHFNPLAYATDPYGNDYFCTVCSQELSSTYYHCGGCEALLGVDYNVCPDCFREKRYEEVRRMKNAIANRLNRTASDWVHLGDGFRNCKSNQCGCHEGNCKQCKLCKKCSCHCHREFTAKRRLYRKGTIKDLLEICEEMVGDDEVQYAEETLARLQCNLMLPDKDGVMKLVLPEEGGGIETESMPEPKDSEVVVADKGGGTETESEPKAREVVVADKGGGSDTELEPKPREVVVPDKGGGTDTESEPNKAREVVVPDEEGGTDTESEPKDSEVVVSDKEEGTDTSVIEPKASEVVVSAIFDFEENTKRL